MKRIGIGVMVGIDVYENQQHVLLVLKEGVDALTVAKFRHLCDDLLVRGIVHFIIDLSQTQTMDSAGIAVLVHLFKQCRHLGGTMRIGKTMSPAARRLLRLTRFDRIFETVDIHHRSFGMPVSGCCSAAAEPVDPTPTGQVDYQLRVAQNVAVLEWQDGLVTHLQRISVTMCHLLHSLSNTAVAAFMQRVNRQFSLS